MQWERVEYLFHASPKHRIQCLKGCETFVRPPPASALVDQSAKVFFLWGSFRRWDDFGEEPWEISIPCFIRPKVGNEFLKEIRRRQLYATDWAIPDTDEDMLLQWVFFILVLCVMRRADMTYDVGFQTLLRHGIHRPTCQRWQGQFQPCQ